MSCPLSPQKLTELRVFVTALKSQPQILHSAELSFFKDFLVSLGAVLPPPAFKPDDCSAAGDRTESGQSETKPSESSSEEDSDLESDVELDTEGVMEGDVVDANQEMGDGSKEPTEEEGDQSDEKRGEAMAAFAEQNFERAVSLYTEAIKLNPQSALLFAKRGQVYLKMSKPNACIKDCSRALELNCDSAAAYKFRGRAYRLLGKWEEAAHDLRESCKIDFDEQANEWLAEVTPNAEKLRQHSLSHQRKKEEKEHREKVRRARKAQEARARAAKSSAPSSGEFPRADAPGAGAGAGSFNPADFSNLLFDPEIMEAFQDPEVAAAFQDVSVNPANILKYQSNPKVASIINKLQAKLGKTGGGAGGFPGGFPGGFGGAGAGAGSGAGKPAGDDDVGLD